MIDTGIWVVLTISVPAAARALLPRLQSRIASWENEIDFWGRAVYGVAPLFGAWVTGAVAGVDCGITGIAPTRWLTGGAISGALLLALALSLRLASVRDAVRRWFHPTHSWLVLFDEPRWAFYRGAAAIPLGPSAAAQLAGLALAGFEWLARNGLPSRTVPTGAWSQLIRLGVSAALFALTRNLWLTLAAQTLAAALVFRSWSDPRTAR